MTPDEARNLIIEGIDYAAYRETDSSLHDADKNRFWGSEHYNSGRLVAKPSPWAESDFEEKMATLLRWANALNRSVAAFKEAQKLLEGDDSVIGRVSGAPNLWIDRLTWLLQHRRLRSERGQRAKSPDHVDFLDRQR